VIPKFIYTPISGLIKVEILDFNSYLWVQSEALHILNESMKSPGPNSWVWRVFPAGAQACPFPHQKRNERLYPELSQQPDLQKQKYGGWGAEEASCKVTLLMRAWGAVCVVLSLAPSRAFPCYRVHWTGGLGTNCYSLRWQQLQFAI